jgi:hypothetical protein
MMRKFLMWLSSKLPAREIRGEDGQAYLERYFVCRVFGCDVFLHRFVASDPDRGLHNHPWEWAASLVLAGRYLEALFDPLGGFPQRMRHAGSFASFGPDHLHRVLIVPGEDCWTLFVVGPRTAQNAWGFLSLVEQDVFPATWTFDLYRKSPTPDWWKTAITGRQLRRLREE